MPEFAVELFSLEECHDYLCESDLAERQMPYPNPWRMTTDECVELLGPEALLDSGRPDELEILRGMVREEMNAGRIDGLESWRAACAQY